MNEDRTHIDRLFHNDLDHLREFPPGDIWTGIDEALSIRDAAKKSKREKRNRYALVLLFLLGAAGSSIFWLINSDGPDEDPSTTAAIYINRSVLKQITRHGEGKPAAVPVNKKTNEIVAVNRYTGNASSESYIDHAFEVQPVSREPFEAVPVAVMERPVELLKEAPDNIPGTARVQAINSIGAVPTSLARKTPSVNKHRLSVIGFFAPDITTRNLEQDVASTPDEGKDQIMNTEKNGMLDYTFGARVDYRLNKHFSIESGLSFSRNTIDIAAKTVYARFDKSGLLKYRFNMSSGYSFFKLLKIPAPQFAGDSAQTSASNSTLHYINVPLAVKYNFALSKKIDLSVQAGITARFIAWESISTTYDYNGANERSISEQIEGLKKSYFNGVIGIGAEYAFNRHISAVLFPSFNFATSSINKDAPVKAYPNTLSIATGLKFNF